MPTSVVASDTIPKGLVTNPFFDYQPIFGIPIWVLVCAFLVMALIVVNMYWIFRLRRLASVKGYVTAMKKATQEDVMVWVLSTSRALTIECLRKRDTIIEFYNKLRITKWFHDSPISVIHIGGKGGLMVTENYYRTRDMVSEIALCHACEEFNQRIEQRISEQKRAGIQPDIRPINDYDDYCDFGRGLLERIHPDGLDIPSFSTFDPQKFAKYFPKGLTGMFFGGIIVRLARKKKVTAKQQGLLEKYLGMGLIVMVVLVVVIAAWMAPLQ